MRIKEYHDKDGFDFTAPIVSSTSDLSDKHVGMMVFDASTNQYKIRAAAGIWSVALKLTDA